MNWPSVAPPPPPLVGTALPCGPSRRRPSAPRPSVPRHGGRRVGGGGGARRGGAPARWRGASTDSGRGAARCAGSARATRPSGGRQAAASTSKSSSCRASRADSPSLTHAPPRGTCSRSAWPPSPPLLVSATALVSAPSLVSALMSGWGGSRASTWPWARVHRHKSVEGTARRSTGALTSGGTRTGTCRCQSPRGRRSSRGGWRWRDRPTRPAAAAVSPSAPTAAAPAAARVAPQQHPPRLQLASQLASRMCLRPGPKRPLRAHRPSLVQAPAASQPLIYSKRRHSQHQLHRLAACRPRSRSRRRRWLHIPRRAWAARHIRRRLRRRHQLGSEGPRCSCLVWWEGPS